MNKKDCKFYDFCFNAHSRKDIEYSKSPCAQCKNEVIGEDVPTICETCCGCDQCHFEQVGDNE